jgi:hypothetical protein
VSPTIIAQRFDLCRGQRRRGQSTVGVILADGIKYNDSIIAGGRRRLRFPEWEPATVATMADQWPISGERRTGSRRVPFIDGIKVWWSDHGGGVYFICKRDTVAIISDRSTVSVGLEGWIKGR